MDEKTNDVHNLCDSCKHKKLIGNMCGCDGIAHPSCYEPDNMKEITAIENKYGLVLFRMGLSHLVDIGHRHLGDDEVAEGIAQIMAKGDEDKVNGKIPIMTPEFQCNILRCATELAGFSIWTLFEYIKKYVVVGTESEAKKQDAGTCPACGSEELEYDGFFVEDSDCIYKWTCEECGVYGRDCYDMIFSESIVDGEGSE